MSLVLAADALAVSLEIPPSAVATGALTGLAYAVLAAGLVLVYRATRVINFAHGQIGALGAAVLAKLVLDHGWNYYLALAAVLVMGGAVGAAVELSVVRRLFTAPRLVLLVATIGVAQLLLLVQILLPEVENIASYPTPIPRTAQLGDLVLQSQHFMVIALVPAVIAGLAYFLTRTPQGLRIRAAAENPDAAELAGVSSRGVSTLVWSLAGVLSTLTFVLINPLRGAVVGVQDQAIGPGLLLRALAAALVGGLVSLPRALAGGVAIGVLEALLFVTTQDSSLIDMVLFVVVLVVVLVRRPQSGETSTGPIALTPKLPAVPVALQHLWWVRRLGALTGGVALLLAVLLPVAFPGPSQNFVFSKVAIYAIIALSVTVLTGWAGQLSLGQFAFVGIGAMSTAGLVAGGTPFLVAVGYGTVIGVAVAVLVGFPALRVRGLFLAVATLAFAVAARSWILEREVFTGGEAFVSVPRATVLGIDLAPQNRYYYLCLAVLVVAAVLVTGLRRSGIGRTIIAVRDNEDAAASFTVAPAVAKLIAFGVSGGLAALAGGLLAGLRVQFGADAFDPNESLLVVAMTVIGGLGSVAGALLGALYVVGLPALFGETPQVALATSSVGLLLLLLYFPGGLVQLLYSARAALLRRATPADPAAVVPVQRRPAVVVESTPTEPLPEGVPVLEAREVTVRFGGREALRSVSLEARDGEVIGLIGSNGAGKSTLMNVITGYLAPTQGAVLLRGQDVSALPAHERARLGMGRVFQDARLFSDLTVRETVQVALEARQRSELVPSLLGLPPSRRAERWMRTEADSYVDFLGLGRYADSYVGSLSTGTRRIVELTCLVSQGSGLLLLDEPTAGVAQRETEKFGPLILSIRKQLGATVVIIEHDIPLIMSMSDRVYCFAAGECIAQGLPEDVRHDPAVVAAYLGTDERAINRSGDAAAGEPTVTPTRVRRRRAAASDDAEPVEVTR